MTRSSTAAICSGLSLAPPASDCEITGGETGGVDEDWMIGGGAGSLFGAGEPVIACLILRRMSMTQIRLTVWVMLWTFFGADDPQQQVKLRTAPTITTFRKTRILRLTYRGATPSQ